MKKMLAVLLVAIVMVTGTAWAEDQSQHERDLKAIGGLVDSRLVAAIVSRDVEKSCPDFNLPDTQLVSEYLEKIVDKEGRFNSEWFANVSNQAMMLDQEIKSIIPAEKKPNQLEIFYRSGVLRQIAIFPNGKVVCGMTLEKNLFK